MAQKLLARIRTAMSGEVETVPVVQPKKKQRRAPNKRRTYATYLYRVLKSIHPDLGISKKAMLIMDSFVEDMFERIMSTAADLARYNKRHTLTTREIQSAVRMVLPRELAVHAVSQGHQHWIQFLGPKTSVE